MVHVLTGDKYDCGTHFSESRFSEIKLSLCLPLTFSEKPAKKVKREKKKKKEKKNFGRIGNILAMKLVEGR